MNRYCLLLCAFLCLSLSSFAQFKNALRMDVPSLARKTIRLSYEHFLSPNYSVGITGSYTESLYWYDQDRLLSRMAVFPEARVYLSSKKTYSGLFASLQLRYQHIIYESYYWGYDENNDPLYVPIHQNFESYGYAVSLGYRDSFSPQSRFGYDAYMGYQMNTGLNKAKIDAPKIQKKVVDTEEFVGLRPQISFSISYAW